jgi:hypothetical protein
MIDTELNGQYRDFAQALSLFNRRQAIHIFLLGDAIEFRPLAVSLARQVVILVDSGLYRGVATSRSLAAIRQLARLAAS